MGDYRRLAHRYCINGKKPLGCHAKKKKEEDGGVPGRKEKVARKTWRLKYKRKVWKAYDLVEKKGSMEGRKGVLERGFTGEREARTQNRDVERDKRRRENTALSVAGTKIVGLR